MRRLAAGYGFSGQQLWLTPKRRTGCDAVQFGDAVHRRTALICLLAFTFLSRINVSLQAAEPIEITRVLGPETKTGDYKHPSSFDELQNGDLYLAYYGGAGEYAEETKVYGLRLVGGTYANNAQWSEPKPIALQPVLSLGNPVVWQARDGILWLFYVTLYCETWSWARISGKIAREHGETLSH